MSRTPNAGSVCIEGATGPNSHLVNGVFELTEELCDGLPAYKRIGTRNEMWLEYNADLFKWKVRQTASRGTAKGHASCSVVSACLPQDCPEGMWQVWSDSQFDVQTGVSVVCLSPIPRHAEMIMEQIREREEREVRAFS